MSRAGPALALYPAARPTGAQPGRDAGAWYLAQLRPNQACRARDHLERQGYRCFLPMRPATRRRAGKLVSGLAPLFPGYLFVRIGAGMQWAPVASTRGVVRLVMRAGHLPQPVPVPVMDELRGRSDAQGVVAPREELSAGDRVRIAAGPMSGFLARVDGHGAPAGDAGYRVGLLLEMMGQAVRAELPAADLDRLAG